MRVTLPGTERTGAPFQLTLDGRPVDAWPGESVAAALLSAGETSLRVRSDGDPRGLWCGMGVCGECRMEIDGVLQLACMTSARAGQHVSRAPERVAAKAEAPSYAASDTRPDVLIVGAGPAGLSAARIAASSGLDVLVVDERAKAGGQYFKQPASGFKVDRTRVDRQTAEGARLIDDAVAAGARFSQGMTLWAATRDGDDGLTLYLSGATGPMRVRPRRLVLAMGAYERPWPVPGWTLPGVMTSGAVQTLLRAYSTAPGQRVLVAGNGPLNTQVARELVRAGCDVVALVEAAEAPTVSMAMHAAAMTLASPGLVLDGMKMLHALRRARVPILHGHVVTRIDGDDRAREVVVARLNEDGTPAKASERRFAVDAVCMGYGFLPQAEAARALGCAVEVGPDGAVRVLRDDCGATSIAGVHVIGDGGGLGGARIAIAQGILAGARLVDACGRLRSDAAEVAAAQRLLARHRAFQAALWQIYASRAPLAISPAGLICRCENISAAAVDAEVAGGANDVAAIKRATRTGMGRCGGRYCATLIHQRLAAQSAVTDSPLPAGFAPRAPFKPTTIDMIVALARDSGRMLNESSPKEH